MTYFFSPKSLEILSTCHPDLIILAEEVIEIFDCTVVHGYRNEELQNQLHDKGLSKLKFPNSKHNRTPSFAIDFVPYPELWQDKEKLIYFAGHVMAIATRLFNEEQMTCELIWGADWDRDHDLKEHKFRDYGHFELDLLL